VSIQPCQRSSEEQTLCHLDELIDGESRGLLREGNDDRLFAIRNGDTVHVYLNFCPHNGRPLEYRRDRFLSGSGDRIICYAHGAHFDIASGHCFHGPCAGESLTKVPVRITGGEVKVPLNLPVALSPQRPQRGQQTNATSTE